MAELWTPPRVERPVPPALPVARVAASAPRSDRANLERTAFIAGILAALLVVGLVVQQMTYEKESRQGAPTSQYVPSGVPADPYGNSNW